METKEITDRDWASSSLTKKEKILFVVYVFASLSILFFTAWLLPSMPHTMMKLVLLCIPLLLCMLLGTMLFMSFERWEQNERRQQNENES